MKANKKSTKKSTTKRSTKKSTSKKSNAGAKKLQAITKRAKEIRKNNPKLKWTTCISKASKELK